jgi:hypothetical protein
MKRSVHETALQLGLHLEIKEQGRNHPLSLLVCDNSCTYIAVVRPIIYAVKLVDNRARIYYHSIGKHADATTAASATA